MRRSESEAFRTNLSLAVPRESWSCIESRLYLVWRSLIAQVQNVSFRKVFNLKRKVSVPNLYDVLVCGSRGELAKVH